MPDQHVTEIKDLEKRIKNLIDALSRLRIDDDLKHLIVIIKQPFWTTPAEFIFASAIINSMQEQVTSLTKLKGELIKGSQAVTGK